MNAQRPTRPIAPLTEADNLIPFPTLDCTVQGAVDTLAALASQGEVAKVLILYERPDGSNGWLSNTFNSVAEQIGFAELLKLEMVRVLNDGASV